MIPEVMVLGGALADDWVMGVEPFGKSPLSPLALHVRTSEGSEVWLHWSPATPAPILDFQPPEQ